MMAEHVIICALSASYYFLFALSFGLEYQTGRFFNIAHAGVYTFGAYMLFLFTGRLNIPLPLGATMAVLLSSVLGLVVYVAIYRYLRSRTSRNDILMLASFGVYLLMQNAISMAFGDDVKSVRFVSSAAGLSVAGVQVIPIQALIVLVAFAACVIAELTMRRTRAGLILRAVSGNPQLASLSGIRCDLVVLMSFAISSAWVGLAGLLVSLDLDMTPTMGLDVLLMGLTVTVIGGAGRPARMALVALALAGLQHGAVWTVGSEWNEAIAFAALLLFLAVKPNRMASLIGEPLIS